MVLVAKVKSNIFEKLADTLSPYFTDKASVISKNKIELIVDFAPWIMMVLLLMSIRSLLHMVDTAGELSGWISKLNLVFLLGTIVLEILAIPELFKKSQKGWNRVFYLVLLGLTSYIINLADLNLGPFIVGIISVLFVFYLIFYLIFQVRSYYK